MSTSSILLRPPPHAASPSPSLSPSPVPALQIDLSSSSSSSSSSSTSGSCLDLHRAQEARSSRRIRFAPLPDPNRDVPLDSSDVLCNESHSFTKSATHTLPCPPDLHDPVALPVSLPSSAQSSPPVCPPSYAPSINSSKSTLKFFRPFTFLRRTNSVSSTKSQSASLVDSRTSSRTSLARPSSPVPNTPSFHQPKFSRVSTEDIFSFGRKTLLRSRSPSTSSTRPTRASSLPSKPSVPSKSNRSISSSTAKLENEKHDRAEGSSRLHNSATITGSGRTKRRTFSSSTSTPGAGGGRHTSSVKMLPGDLSARPNTAPSPSLAATQKRVRMLNGRVYGKKSDASALSNPFANVRDEPEFVEWGYGGMGSVDASAGIANDMWKGLQRSERGGALFAGSSFGSPSASTHPTGTLAAGGGRGSGARPTSPIARRKMADNVPECGMGSVGVSGGTDQDDGSGMNWVKKRRAEREAKARLEQEAKDLERMTQDKDEGQSGDWMDASMHASTASVATSRTACTSTDLTTPATSPLASRTPSVTDLRTTPSSCQPRDLHAMLPYADQQPSKSDTASPHPSPTATDEHHHHVLTAIRLSPNLATSSREHEQEASNANSFEEELERRPDGEEERDDDDAEREAQGTRKTVLGAGVEKISRHVDVEVR